MDDFKVLQRDGKKKYYQVFPMWGNSPSKLKSKKIRTFLDELNLRYFVSRFLLQEIQIFQGESDPKQ